MSDDPLLLAASPWKSHFTIPDDVTYLNHGSFGPAPHSVQDSRRAWSERLERQPMQFFVRDLENVLDEAAGKLGDFIGAPAKDLIFADNATFGMNIVAETVDLQPGDEVLLNDHEYGAVTRIWQRRCRRSDAKAVLTKLPFPTGDDQSATASLVQSLFAAVTDRTKLIVVSHITSPTALILPVAEICREAKSRGIPTCIDGPHAVAMLPLSLKELGCDFYTASCHKWLSAPLGSGFLYVAPQWQGKTQPVIVSWGGSVTGRQPSWKDEFQWLGTRDPAGFLSVPTAIEFLQNIGVELFREHGHALAREFRERMKALTGLPPVLPDSSAWFGTMAAMPLPPLNADPPKNGQRDPLQNALWERFRIEIPVVHWQGQRFLRVSCHLYNDRADLDRLMDALQTTLP